ncbi:MAG: phospholipase D family protein [candidate division WOR-3 bacterium]
MFLLMIFFSIQVYFSPNGGAKEAILREIENAKNTIDVAMYILTDRELSNALVLARERGVTIKVLLDGKSAKEIEYSKHLFLKNKNVDVRLYEAPPSNYRKYKGIMHNKFAIIDKKTIITGSFNWTHSAEELNNENLLIIKDEKELIKKFQHEFSKLWEKGKSPIIYPELDPYNVKKLREYIGEWVIICGKPTSWKISRSTNLFLNFGEGKDHLTFVLWKEGVNELKEKGFDFNKLTNSKVKIEGKLIDHEKYGLEITTSDPTAIQIVKN